MYTYVILSVLSMFLFMSCNRMHTGALPSGQHHLSEHIARSFLVMHPDTIVYHDEAKSRRWNYEQGLMLEAFYQMWVHSRDNRYLGYVKRNLEYYIDTVGAIRTYAMEDFNLDNIAPGKVVVRLFRQTGDDRYRTAASHLREQLRSQPRTSGGGFWHKKIYPFQMWLDGLYMAESFYTLYALEFRDSAAFDDIARQFLLVEQHNRDTRTGLYYHGWDESRTQRWSDPKTGRSPNFWGRSNGWFAMALVDVLEYFPQIHSRRPDIERIFRNLMQSVLAYRESTTGLWYQVMDKAGAKGNYREASASTMFTYALAKGTRLGYLPPEAGNTARESLHAIMDHLVTAGEDSTLHLHDVCRVAGLGGNPYRDGSYQYYTSEPRRTDDFKGYGPLLLAAIEIERLAAQQKQNPTEPGTRQP